MSAYFLAFKGGDVPQASLHPCYLAEDLSRKEMEILQQVMERKWGYDEELAGPRDDWFEFQVVGATEDTVDFVELRHQWGAFTAGRDVGHWNDTIQSLHRSAEDYAVHIRETRSQLPRGYFLTVDYGGGEGEVFNFVDNLTEREIDILEALLGKYIYEQGGVFRIAAKDDLAVEEPAKCIHLQWDWDILKERIESNDFPENDRTLGDYRLSCNLIGRILEWRATALELESDEPESDEAERTENGADNQIVRADTAAQSTVRKDSEKDTGQNSAPRLPDTPDVLDLCRRLQKELPKGRTQNEIAREFTSEMPDDDKKGAISLEAGSALSASVGQCGRVIVRADSIFDEVRAFMV